MKEVFKIRDKYVILMSVLRSRLSEREANEWREGNSRVCSVGCLASCAANIGHSIKTSHFVLLGTYIPIFYTNIVNLERMFVERANPRNYWFELKYCLCVVSNKVHLAKRKAIDFCAI